MPKKISLFYKELGLPLKMVRQSWGARSNLGILLTTWDDQMDAGRWHVRVLKPGTTRSRDNGRRERIDHLRLLWGGGMPAYTVIAKAKDEEARPRAIASYEEHSVRAIDSLVRRDDGSIWAELGDVVPVAKLKRHAKNHRLVAAEGTFPQMQFDKTPKKSGVVKPPARFVATLPAIRAELIRIAQSRKTITYAQARTPYHLGTFEHRHAMDRLGNECLNAGEPILTSLIVDADTGRCSSGFEKEFKCDDAEERERCYAFWSSDGELEASGSTRRKDRKALRESAARFAKVATRPHQQAFRRDVFLAHGGTCVVTGCTVLEALDAAHRRGRDWRLHNRAEDGLLLRKDIHSLYDAGLLHISNRGSIRFDKRAADHYRAYA